MRGLLAARCSSGDGSRRWLAGRAVALAAMLLLAPSCRRERPASGFDARVAPLLARHCAGCHGGAGRKAAATPSLASYAEAARVAGAIARSVRRREMPPWPADNTGECGTWRDALWLDGDDIAALAGWADQGAPRGELASTAAPAPPPPPDLGRQRLTLDPGVSFTPRPGGGSSRCYRVTPALERNALVTAVRGLADGGGPIAQMALHALDDDAAVRAAAALDGRDGAPGWPCSFGSGIEGTRLVTAWSWATPLLRMPAGTGVPLQAGRPLVLQVHVDLAVVGLAGAAHPRLELETGPAREATLLPVRAGGLRLAPGQKQVEVTSELLVDRRLDLLGVVPRMRDLGRVLQLARRRGGERTCLAHFGHWDPYQAQLFVSANPVSLEPGDRVTLSCTFNTVSRDSTLEGREGEECLALLYVVPR